MDEAIDQKVTVRYPQLADAPPLITLAHQALQRQQGGGLCSIPLLSSGQIVGAVHFEFADEQSFDNTTIATAEHLISLVGPVLELMWRNELPLHKQLAGRLRLLHQQLGAPERRRLRFALISGTVAALILLFIPLPHQVGGQARIEGAIQRILVAPADGYIKQVFVRPGDTVEAGQVLVEMAEQDLQIERRRWSSELAQHENAYAAALARADRAQLVINQARADEARAQLALIDQQLGRASIEAPFAGIVIKGDLSQSLGAPVKRGDTLLTVAPDENSASSSKSTSATLPVLPSAIAATLPCRRSPGTSNQSPSAASRQWPQPSKAAIFLKLKPNSTLPRTACVPACRALRE